MKLFEDIKTGLAQAIDYEKLTTEEFYEKYCQNCGSQKCSGVNDENWGPGCGYYNKWKGNDD